MAAKLTEVRIGKKGYVCVNCGKSCKNIAIRRGKAYCCDKCPKEVKEFCRFC